jgi:hypothetical protein
MSFDSLFVPEIRRSRSVLVEYSDIFGCDAAPTVNTYLRFGGCCCHSSQCLSKNSVWLVSSFQKGKERASSAESDGRNNVPTLLEPEESDFTNRQCVAC